MQSFEDKTTIKTLKETISNKQEMIVSLQQQIDIQKTFIEQETQKRS